MLRLFIISLIRNGVMKIIRVENWVSGYYFGNLIRIFVIVFYISIFCSGEILYLIYGFFFFLLIG